MFHNRFFRAAAGVLAALLLSSGAQAADSAGVVSAALGEVGYTEIADEYTKFGDWYGLPNSYWCDMFVSWCAMQGGTAKEQFPRHCSCTAHVRLFTEMGRYQDSSARGGSYIPQQGTSFSSITIRTTRKGTYAATPGWCCTQRTGMSTLLRATP